MCSRYSLLLIVTGFVIKSCNTNPNDPKPLPPEVEETVICIQPIGAVDKVMLDSVKKTVAKAYPFKITIASPIELPKNFRSLRGAHRYRADSIIRYLRRMNSDAHRIIGLTGYEIATTKYSNFEEKKIKDPEWRYKDWGIFGLGFCPGRSCVVSYYYLKQRSQKLMMSRLRKISIHEIGHTLGLPHCPDKNCVMTDACEKITTIDNTKGVLCEKCKRNIGYR